VPIISRPCRRLLRVCRGFTGSVRQSSWWRQATGRGYYAVDPPLPWSSQYPGRSGRCENCGLTLGAKQDFQNLGRPLQRRGICNLHRYLIVLEEHSAYQVMTMMVRKRVQKLQCEHPVLARVRGHSALRSDSAMRTVHRRRKQQVEMSDQTQNNGIPTRFSIGCTSMKVRMRQGQSSRIQLP